MTILTSFGYCTELFSQSDDHAGVSLWLTGMWFDPIDFWSEC